MTLYRGESGSINGNTGDRDGKLIGCRHGARDVVRIEHDGRLTALADGWQGRRLNSPNDVVLSADGAIWFTDPTYGLILDFEGYRSPPEREARDAFRIAAECGLSVVVDDFHPAQRPVPFARRVAAAYRQKRIEP